jgi:hypothetical protein
MPQFTDRPLEHFFAHRVYVRQLKTPAGVVSVSKIHRFSQVNFLMQGRISIKTPEGVIHRVAPTIWVSPAGSKSVTYFHEDTVWASAHGADEQDIDKLEEELVCKTFEEFDKMEAV